MQREAHEDLYWGNQDKEQPSVKQIKVTITARLFELGFGSIQVCNFSAPKKLRASTQKKSMWHRQKKRIGFRPLLALSLTNQSTIDDIPTIVSLRKDASYAARTKLYCLFELFYESKRRLLLKAYSTPKHEFNVRDMAWKLISKCRWKYEKYTNVLGAQTFNLRNL